KERFIMVTIHSFAYPINGPPIESQGIGRGKWTPCQISLYLGYIFFFRIFRFAHNAFVRMIVCKFVPVVFLIMELMQNFTGTSDKISVLLKMFIEGPFIFIKIQGRIRIFVNSSTAWP